MISKIVRIAMLLALTLSFVALNSSSTSAATKVMWGKTELKVGQIGKITILDETDLVKLESDGSLKVVRVLNKGEEFRVYSYKSNYGGLYGVGGGNFIQVKSETKYETPSKSKLAQLEASVRNNPATVVTVPTTPKVEDGLEVVKGAPTGFPNCTALNKHYPNGVKKGHPAYASKHDRDKDNWACEQN